MNPKSYLRMCGSGGAGQDTYDQNGQIINSATTQDRWMERTVDLSAFAGKTISMLGVVTDAQTGACTWDIYYSDMAIVSTDGTVTPIYDRESAVSLEYYSSAGITNATAAAERSNTADDAEQPGNSTTYYVGDQIGSERMLMAAGGWPLSSDTYYPYGTEATPSAGANHYKFTGKERDYASGNDYFGPRYYSSSMGRWMSPDYSYDYDPEPVPHADLENPQTLNLYSYVQNNPLSNIDPDGHSNEGCTSSSTQDPDGTLHVVVNCPRIVPDSSGTLYRLAGMAGFFGGEFDPANLLVAGGLLTAGYIAAHPIHFSLSGNNSAASPVVGSAQSTPGDPNQKPKPKLVSNQKHHPNSSSPEPPNVKELYDNAIEDSKGRWWAKDADGTINRFSAESNGETHWNGSTAGSNPIKMDNIPSEIRNALQ